MATVRIRSSYIQKNIHIISGADFSFLASTCFSLIIFSFSGASRLCAVDVIAKVYESDAPKFRRRLRIVKIGNSQAEFPIFLPRSFDSAEDTVR